MLLFIIVTFCLQILGWRWIEGKFVIAKGECAPNWRGVCLFCVFVSSFGYPTITHTRMHVSACMMQIPTAYISVYENWCISVHCTLCIQCHALYEYVTYYPWVIHIRVCMCMLSAYTQPEAEGEFQFVSVWHLQASHMLVCIVFSMHTIGTVRYLAFRSIVSEVSYYPFEFLTSRSSVSRL